jgi:hypothetical protein
VSGTCSSSPPIFIRAKSGRAYSNKWLTKSGHLLSPESAKSFLMIPMASAAAFARPEHGTRKTANAPRNAHGGRGDALLSEVQPALAVALDSLGGTMPKQVEGRYYFFAAAHINRAVDAFILLRG